MYIVVSNMRSRSELNVCLDVARAQVTDAQSVPTITVCLDLARIHHRWCPYKNRGNRQWATG